MKGSTNLENNILIVEKKNKRNGGKGIFDRLFCKLKEKAK
jgi:hypothetical protein